MSISESGSAFDLIMALSPKQELRQSQSLVMTPQLQQAIKLLQLSSRELDAFIEEEIERNPLLERDEQPSAADGDEQERAGEGATDTGFEGQYPDEAPDDDFFPSAAGYGGRGDGAGGFAGLDLDAAQNITSAVTRRDHLTRQLALEIVDPVDRLIGSQLIDALDEAGYVSEGLDEIAAAMGCDSARVEGVLAVLQRFDPPGMFARTLSECLALQLRERNRLDPAIAAMLDHLDLLAAGDVAALVRVCGVEAEDIAEMAAEIRALDPKPGTRFADEIVETVVPDVYLRAAPDGGWRVELNSDALPKVLVNRYYGSRLTRATRSKDERAFITERLHAANWLVRSLDQRAKTILRVATEIVAQQDAFFRHGIQCLRPLTLRDIAERVELHESTVSRVTSNKYMATPRGTYELKYFFTAALGSSQGGESHSAAAVKHRIKRLIEAETSKSVLSDDRIAQILVEDGIDIARRTVAKYREALRIPSSSERRRRLRSGL